MDLREIFINNLKKYRKAQNLSQMALAEQCETSTSYIGEIETGRKFPSIDMIQKMSATLKIDAYKLFINNDKETQTELSPELKEKIISLKNELEMLIK